MREEEYLLSKDLTKFLEDGKQMEKQWLMKLP